MNPIHWHLDALDRTLEASVLFLARPAVPELLKATEIAPQFCCESLRIDALRTGRRLALIDRILESHPSPA